MLRLVIRLLLAGMSALVGVAGLLLPVLPGWLFFGIAALLLFPNSRPARRTFSAVERRWPSMHRVLRFLVR